MIERSALVAEYQRLKKQLGHDPSRQEWREHAKISDGNIARLFCRWRDFAAAAMANTEGAPGPGEARDLAILQDRIKTLQADLIEARKESLNQEIIRREIFGLAQQEVESPEWAISTLLASNSPGVPTLFASDWHWDEVVEPSQIGGVNAYSRAIAHDRARTLVENTVHLLNDHMVNPRYPGIVFALGGDMVSGDIHEELSKTNEASPAKTVVDLVGVLQWCIKALADQFGRVFIPCVTGNHGRLTKKIQAKDRTGTNLDWLTYTFLEMLFKDDDRVTFMIPDGPDAYYRVYHHRYLLTHGDQFRGGDGMIGALGPLIRGDHKKRSRNGQIGMDYDTMLCGHWHQLIQLQRLIVNGSLKGYDEYAFSNNFGYEPARQALWITHPNHGITFSMPVLVEPSEQRGQAGWVSIPE